MDAVFEELRTKSSLTYSVELTTKGFAYTFQNGYSRVVTDADVQLRFRHCAKAGFHDAEVSQYLRRKQEDLARREVERDAFNRVQRTLKNVNGWWWFFTSTTFYLHYWRNELEALYRSTFVRLLSEGQDPTDALRTWYCIRGLEFGPLHPGFDLDILVLLFTYGAHPITFEVARDFEVDEDEVDEEAVEWYNYFTGLVAEAKGMFDDIVKQRCHLIKEELVAKVYHPNRVDRFGGADWLDALD